MNREIKFRAQRTDTKEFVYGYYVKDPIGNYRIYLKPFEEATSNTYYTVIPDSVCQFTGLLDKKGKEIYEGDILKLSNKEIIEVSFKSGKYLGVRNNGTVSLSSFYWIYAEIIGTIYENKNLINQ